MKSNNEPPIRVNKRFYDIIKDIQIKDLQKRISHGDKNIKSLPTSKITLAMAKHLSMSKIKEDILKEYKWD